MQEEEDELLDVRMKLPSALISKTVFRITLNIFNFFIVVIVTDIVLTLVTPKTKFIELKQETIKMLQFSQVHLIDGLLLW